VDSLQFLEEITHRYALSIPQLVGWRNLRCKKLLQELAGFYSKIFPDNHVLVLYDRLPRLLHIHGVIASDGRVVEGPTSGDVITAHKKIQKGYLQIGLWGFHMYIFREGRLKNLGDGGFQNWAWRSPKFKRDGKEVEFELVELSGEKS